MLNPNRSEELLKEYNENEQWVECDLKAYREISHESTLNQEIEISQRLDIEESSYVNKFES